VNNWPSAQVEYTDGTAIVEVTLPVEACQEVVSQEMEEACLEIRGAKSVKVKVNPLVIF
jgi:metal-sulfur cluster biosynthetic enzyme